MSDSLRDFRLQLLFNEPNSTFSKLKIDGAEAADDDNESGFSSVSHLPSDDDQSSRRSVLSLHSDWSKRKKYILRKLQISDPVLYKTWRLLQEEKKRLQIKEECFLADLSPDHFLRDDDQSSSSSDPSLHSDWSNGRMINFKKFKKSDPVLYQRWQRLQRQREQLQIEEELVLADLSPDCFLSDDAQSSRPSDPSLHSDDAQSSRPSDPSLHSDDDQSSSPSDPSLHSDDDQSSSPSDPSLHSDDAQLSRPSDPSLPTRDQIRQRLQQLREQLRVREERFLARLPPDLDDDQSSRPSDPSLHSDQSKEKMIDLKKIEIDYPAWDQSLLPEREDF